MCVKTAERPGNITHKTFINDIPPRRYSIFTLAKFQVLRVCRGN